MKLRGINVSSQRLFSNKIISTSLSWTFASERRLKIDVYHGSLDYFAVLGAYLHNVAILREYAPFAYVLTNNRLPTDPPPSYASSSHTLPSNLLASHPYVKLDFDYFAESNILRREQISYLIALNREDISIFQEELLGLTPPPLQASLLLAKGKGLENWISETTIKAINNDEWESLILDRFSIFLWVHEGERLFLSTKDSKFLESYGLLNNKMKEAD